MASPLGWFRRHQKGMLIVFGVLLMAVFGLPAAFQNMIAAPGGGRDLNQAVVKFNGGQFTRGDFLGYRNRNAEAVRFIQELMAVSAKEQGDSFRPTAAPFGGISGNGSPQQTDLEVMRRILLERKAEELGLQVGNEAVLDYLKGVAGNLDLTEQDLTQFAFEIFRGRADYITIREQLKREIAARQMFAIEQNTGQRFGVASVGLPGAPSITEAWQDWLKLNRRRAATVMAFPVEEYLDKVAGEPSTAEIREIFAEGEYQYPDPTNELPGFKLRRRVKVGMMRASYEDFLTNEMNKVSNEAVQNLYDQMVERKDPTVMEFVPRETKSADQDPSDPAPSLDDLNLQGEDQVDEPTEAAGSSSKDDENKDGDSESKPEESKDSKSEDSKKREPKSQDDSSQGTEVKKPEKAEKEEGKPGNSESENKKEDGKSGEKSGEKSGGKNADDQGDGLPLSGPSAGRFYQDKQEEAKQEEAKQEEAKQEEAKQEETDDQKGAAGDDATDSAATTDPDPSAEMQTDPVDPVPVPDEAPSTDPLIGDLQDPVERRVKPLDEELAKTLKRQLASEPATNSLISALQDAASDLSFYGSELQAWETSQDLPASERVEKPQPIDAEKIAREYKLNYQVTDLIDVAQLQELELGKLNITELVEIAPGQRFPYPRPLFSYVFQNYYNFTPWIAETAPVQASNDQVIVFLIEKADPKIRTIDEARQDVIEFWRYQEAIKLAKSAAEKVAATVSGGMALSELHPDDAKAVGEFTYQTSGARYPQLSIGGDASATPPVDPEYISTGKLFMDAAFGVEINKAGAALDLFRENCYVIHVTDVDDRSEDTLREEFFSEMNVNKGLGQGVRTLFSFDQVDFFDSYFEKIDKEFGVKWLAH